MFSENGMMLALQARKVAEHRCRKACLRELRVVESFESWTMSGILIFLEFLNVFRKWYDAGTTGHERGGASIPESSGLRVHRELNDVCYVEFLRVLECFQKML